jgi:CRP-like cAMP-binding protein
MKGTVQINGSKIIPNPKDKLSVVLEMADGKTLDMEAKDETSAKAWINAIQETLSIFQSNATSKKDKKRRDDVVMEKSSEAKTTPKTNTKTTAASYKSEGTKTFLRDSLQDHFLLGSLDNFNPLIDSLNLIVSLPGDVVIWQDDIGDLFFVLENGSTQIFKGNSIIGNMKPGTAFGELALINDVKRAATIRTDSVCRIWSLDRATFRRVLSSQENHNKEEKISFLRNIKLFEKLTDLSLSKVADALNIAKFQAGSKLFKQGDVGNALYIIYTGNIQLTQNSSFGGSATDLAKLGPGNSFGELALIKDEPRKATATAIDNVVCYTLDRVNFNSILGDLSSAIDENVGTMILKKVSILKDLNDNQLQAISRRLGRIVYQPGKTIIKQGEEGNSFYMIATGEVSVVVNNSEVASLATGAYFGTYHYYYYCYYYYYYYYYCYYYYYYYYYYYN